MAIVSTGVNYTLPEVAARLARDGEGEMIGWDFTDGDNRPFDASRGTTPAPHGGDGTALASLLLAEPARVSLVAVRVDPADAASLARALVFVAQTPARVVLMAVSSVRLEDWVPFRQALERFRQLLVVVPAGGERAGELASPVFPAALGLKNVLVVPGGAEEPGAAAAGFNGTAVALPASVAEAVRVAAAAAQMAARVPGLDGAGLRRAILLELGGSARGSPGEQ